MKKRGRPTIIKKEASDDPIGKQLELFRDEIPDQVDIVNLIMTKEFKYCKQTGEITYR